MHPELARAKQDYDDIVDSNIRVHGLAAGEQILQTMGNELQKNLHLSTEETATTLQQFPAYAALTLRRCLKIIAPREIEKRADRTDGEACIREVAAAGAVQVSEKGKPTWDILKSLAPDTAWTAIVLVALRKAAPAPEAPEEEKEESPDYQWEEWN